MNRLFSIICLFVLSINTYAQLGYRYGSEFIELFPKNDSTFYVDIRNDKSIDLKYLLERDGKSVYPISGYQLIINGAVNNFKDCYISPFYSNPRRNGSVIILPEILVFSHNKDIIAKIIKEYGDRLSLISIVADEKYKFSCNTNSSQEVLRMVAEIDKKEGVEWCEPNMLSDFKSTSNPYYPYQFYLKNTDSSGIDINIQSAWNMINGSENIKVAVLDEGVDINHEDLYGNIISGYTVNRPTGYGNIINSYFTHGTCCAGIIGANNNNIGIRGVAAGVKLIPINITKGTIWSDGLTIFADNDSIANAIRWACDHGADILSCSWGGDYDNSAIRSAIQYARTTGRNGKGSIVIAASGNSHESIPTRIMFPAKIDGVIAVGAVDRYGTVCHYSQRGDSLDLVAPSNRIYETGEIYTTTNTGTGNISSNYRSDFGGTSAACPQVAGVAALMLSMDSTLTGTQVSNILRSSCRKLPNYTYNYNGWNSEVGYGLVDAYAAVSAINSSIAGKTVLCDTATYTITYLPEGYTVIWTVNNNNFSITPSAYHCFVSYTGQPQYETANLTATVSWNGHVIKTLTKEIIMHGTDMYVEGVQSGIYDENGDMPAVAATFTIPASSGMRGAGNRLSMINRASLEMTSIPVIFENTRLLSIPDNPTYGITEIYGGADIFLDGARLDGMTISFSGDRAPEYLYSDGGSMISFRMPEVSSITDVQGYYYVVLHATSEGGCHDFDLYFKVIPVEGESIGDPEISLYFTDSSVRVDFDAMEWEELPGGMLQATPWYLKIYRMPALGNPSNQLMHSSTNYTESKTVDIGNWPSGIYLVRVDSHGDTYTKKFLKQ